MPRRPLMPSDSLDPTPHLVDPPSSGGLARTVTSPLLLLLVIGDILGAGIYILVGDVAGELGPAAWLAFVAAFAIAAMSASSYSELVTRFPGAAGSALYAHKAFGRTRVTFFVGWRSSSAH
ncbi:MAG: APA family basic amino acid/polyamine antiporter [Candidatus Poriferisodalaceae bacterium]|jgi:APA family basic amino acid/polyamine antiporter